MCGSASRAVTRASRRMRSRLAGALSGLTSRAFSATNRSGLGWRDLLDAAQPATTEDADDLEAGDGHGCRQETGWGGRSLVGARDVVLVAAFAPYTRQRLVQFHLAHEHRGLCGEAAAILVQRRPFAELF